MGKYITAGIVTAIATLTIGGAVASAQTPTASPAPTSTTNTTVPSAAPSTGFGN